jgi:hypothetical protein
VARKTVIALPKLRETERKEGKPPYLDEPRIRRAAELREAFALILVWVAGFLFFYGAAALRAGSFALMFVETLSGFGAKCTR